MTMFKNERLSMILNTLQHRRVMTTTELQKILYVSGSTLRRDLIDLEKLGKITRKFGRVELVRPDNIELSYLFREQENEAAKRYIAEIADTFLTDNQAILVDSSSTASFLSTYFSKLNNLVVITNGLRLAVELDGITKVRTFVPGGWLRPGAGSILGDTVLEFLDNFRADLFFLSCTGITTEGVFMSSEEQSSVKRRMLRRGDKVILLCDHSKFDVKGYFKLCDYDQIDVIITDKKPPQPFLEHWQQMNVEVLY